MHEGLRLGGARVQNTPGIEQDVENVRVGVWNTIVPGDKGSVAGQAGDVDHFFSGDGELQHGSQILLSEVYIK